jgi:GTP-binding protein
MGVLIETMRREGFELSISPPRVIYKDGGLDDKGKRIILEPMEEVNISVTHELSGGVCGVFLIFR